MIAKKSLAAAPKRLQRLMMRLMQYDVERQLDEHLRTYALSHARQVNGEMQKLKHIVYKKVMDLLHVYPLGQ